MGGICSLIVCRFERRHGFFTPPGNKSVVSTSIRGSASSYTHTHPPHVSLDMPGNNDKLYTLELVGLYVAFGDRRMVDE